MKKYKYVIKERYDKLRYNGRGIMDNIYSVINPIGFYGEFKAAQILKSFVLMMDSSRNFLDEIKICDCGCGIGTKTRILAELLGNPNQVYGTEYSKNSLKHCQDMNPFIHYAYADLTSEKGIPFEVQFDGITAFVVFMHFTSEKEILAALKNIYNSLKRKGIFLWYEANVKSHWDGKKKDIDGWGFSAKEMDNYAKKVGFRLLKKFEVFTRIPIIDMSTIYLAKDIESIGILELMEKLPFKKNNNIRIYIKE